MHAVFREALVRAAGHEGVEKFDETVAALFRDFGDPRGGALQTAIRLRGIGHRRTERLVPRRCEQNEFGAELFERGQQLLIPFLKPFEAGVAVGKRRFAAVTDEQGRRTGVGDMIHQDRKAEPLLGAGRLPRAGVLVGAKLRAGRAQHVIRRPADIAEREVVLRPARGQGRFEETVFFHPGNQRVAEEDDPIPWAIRRGRDFLVGIVVEIAVEFPVTHDRLRHRFHFARHQLGDLLLGQGPSVNAHVVEASVERFIAPVVSADGADRRTARSELPGLRKLADFLTVDIEPHLLSIEGPRHMMPLAVEEFGGFVGGGNLRVFAADSQAEPQAPNPLGPADRHEAAVASVLDAEDGLLALRLHGRLDPRADRGPIERAQFGIRRNADHRGLRIELDRLASLPLDVFRLPVFRARAAFGRRGRRRECRCLDGGCFAKRAGGTAVGDDPDFPPGLRRRGQSGPAIRHLRVLRGLPPTAVPQIADTGVELLAIARDEDMEGRLLSAGRGQLPAEGKLIQREAERVGDRLGDEIARRLHAEIDRGVGILGTLRRIDVSGQIPHRDHRVFFILEILHVSRELRLTRTHPAMVQRRNAVKIQHADLAVPRLLDGPFQIVEAPLWPRVARRRNEQRMIALRVVGRPASAFAAVGKFRVDTPPREQESQSLQRPHGLQAVVVARIAKRRGLRDSIFDAPLVDVLHRRGELLLRKPGDIFVMLRVVADFETHVVQFADVLPREVALLVLEKTEALRDVEGRAEPVLFQNVRDERAVRLVPVVEREHDEFVRDRLQLLRLPRQREETRQRKQDRSGAEEMSADGIWRRENWEIHGVLLNYQRGPASASLRSGERRGWA